MLLVAVAPLITVGWALTLAEPLTPDLFQSHPSWSDLWLMPVLMAVLLAGFALAILLPATEMFRRWPLTIKVATTTVFALFTILMLWIGVVLAYAVVASVYFHALPGANNLPTWVWGLGGIWTAVILLGLFYLADHLYLASTETEV